MANTDAPRGLKPIRHLTGDNIVTNDFVMDTSASAIYRGDAVVLEADGKINSAKGDPNGTYLGVAAKYAAQGTAATIPVWLADDIVFEIQADASLAVTSIGACSKLVTTAGDATLGLSKYELDASDLDTSSSATRVLQILGKRNVQDPGAGALNAWGSFVKLEVIFVKGIKVDNEIV